jgi:hypothetical protein
MYQTGDLKMVEKNLKEEIKGTILLLCLIKLSVKCIKSDKVHNGFRVCGL